jgi:hypothetical protein
MRPEYQSLSLSQAFSPCELSVHVNLSNNSLQCDQEKTISIYESLPSHECTNQLEYISFVPLLGLN